MVTLTTALGIRRGIESQADETSASFDLDSILSIQRALLTHQETLTTALLELQQGQFSSGRPSMSVDTQEKLRAWRGEQGNHAAPRYMIRRPSRGDYVYWHWDGEGAGEWSNRNVATVYSDTERAVVPLPDGGEWLLLLPV